MAEDNNFRPRARRGGRDERPARNAQTPAVPNTSSQNSSGQNNSGQGNSNSRSGEGNRQGNRQGNRPQAGRTTSVSGGEFSRPNGESSPARGDRPTFQPTPGQAASDEGRAREEGRTSSSQSGSHSSSQSGSKRRIVTLERTRPEYSRPVNVTVQRVYFGDWDGSNLKADEPERGDYRRGGNSGARADRGFQGRPPRGGVSTAPKAVSDGAPNARGESQPGRGGGSAQPRSAQARTPQARTPQTVVPQEQEIGSSATPSGAEGATGGDGAARRRRRRRRRPSSNAAGSSEG